MANWVFRSTFENLHPHSSRRNLSTKHCPTKKNSAHVSRIGCSWLPRPRRGHEQSICLTRPTERRRSHLQTSNCKTESKATPTCRTRACGCSRAPQQSLDWATEVNTSATAILLSQNGKKIRASEHRRERDVRVSRDVTSGGCCENSRRSQSRLSSRFERTHSEV